MGDIRPKDQAEIRPGEAQAGVSSESPGPPNSDRFIRASEPFSLIFVPAVPIPSPRTSSMSAPWVGALGGEIEVDIDDPARPVTLIDFTRRPITDDDLANLKELTSLQTLELGDTPITDATLGHLNDLTGLRVLCLTGTRISDAGLVHLRALTNLHELELIRTEVTDAGLAYLQNLKGLHTLGLSLTRVSDTGLRYLRELANLEWLDLMGTNVTHQGVHELQKAIPKLYVPWLSLASLGVDVYRVAKGDTKIVPPLA